MPEKERDKMTMTKEEIKNLNWMQVVTGNIPEELKDKFSDAVWYYNTGEWDYSSYTFTKAKEELLKSF